MGAEVLSFYRRRAIQPNLHTLCTTDKIGLSEIIDAF